MPGERRGLVNQPETFLIKGQIVENLVAEHNRREAAKGGKHPTGGAKHARLGEEVITDD